LSFAKNEVGILETKAGKKQKKRCCKPKKAAKAGLAISNYMGVRTEKHEFAVQENQGVYGPVSMKSVELFAGAGGLGMGVSKAGFKHEMVIEWDRDACDTIRINKDRGVYPVSDWPVFQGDVRTFDFSALPRDITLLSGGPPCQPFSLGGKHRGHNDERDMFPQAVRAVRELRPKAFLFENVKGLLRQSFAKYFEYILLQLTYPEINRRKDDDWQSHLERLEQYHTKGMNDGLFYRVVFRLLNSADFGVPQKRERVIIVGFRSDIGLQWTFPSVTHSQKSLLWDQWITNEYWDRHKISKNKMPDIPIDGIRERVLKNSRPAEKPWVTVRDAISDLPKPKENGACNGVLNHRLIQGARAYSGHTGSLLDEPAKTLKAGDHGVPGGENMLVLPDKSLRYFTVRESARLQTFPDDYIFTGSWTESMRQLGNAVPVTLSHVISSNIKDRLSPART
jgi:DNA (cytosine-5)-methyltransferase 1